MADLILGGHEPHRCLFVFLEVEYTEGEAETYVVPVSFAAGDAAANLGHRAPEAVICPVEVEGAEQPRGILYDAFAAGEAARVVLHLARSRGALPGERGRLAGSSVKALREQLEEEPTSIRAAQLEQTNSTAQIGDRAIVKLVRQLEAGTNAELEIGTFFAENAPRARVARILGSVSYKVQGRDPAAVAILTQFVPNEGLAWGLFTNELESLFEVALSRTDDAPPPAPPDCALSGESIAPPAPLVELATQHFRRARQLGVVTAEVHAALARGTDPAFVPEPYTLMYQQSLYQRARTMFVRTLEQLERGLHQLAPEVATDVRDLSESRADVDRQLARILEPVEALRIRCHGDLHLGQVLFTGDDFVIIDFEGEPARPLGERRYKRNPLLDVAGMLRSFSYVAESCLRVGRQRSEDQAKLRPWASAWASWIGAAYLEGYLGAVEREDFVPRESAVRRRLLDFFALEKCIYEIGYELSARPGWLPIPIRGLLDKVRLASTG